MGNNYVLPLCDLQANLENVGGKGASLARLAADGLPVPSGFHITTEAYRQFVAANNLQPHILTALESVDVSQPATLEKASQAISQLFMQAAMPAPIADAITKAYSDMSAQPVAVAVRSSATAEDLPEASFAGQQETYLNICGTDAVLEAVKKCWASLWTARAIGYRARHNIDPQSVALAVVVQALVFADAAGILFTANPMNGRRSEALINAAWGLGEAIVGGLVTPDTLTVEKISGKVLSRETAEKQMMTVRTALGTEQQPVPENLRRAEVLSDEQALELTQLGVQIENQYGMPMDIEWALTEDKFSVLQARPITALPEMDNSIKIEWTPPDPKGVYMRGGVVDLMPTPLTPLYASLSLPSLIRQEQLQAKHLTGIEPVFAKDYFTSINSYAYMNANIPAKTWWWIIFGLLPAYPKILRKPISLWRDEYHPQYRAAVARYAEKTPETMSSLELWQNVRELVDIANFYVGGLLFATMGASAGAEGLCTQVYNKLAKREGDPDASALLIGWDNIPVRAEKSLYDLAQWSRQQEALAHFIQETPSEQLVSLLTDDHSPVQVPEDEWKEFKNRFENHMKQYGYILFQLDFAESLPLDHPEPMLENIKMYLRGMGTNPYMRQQKAEEKRIRTANSMLGRLKGLKRWAFRHALKIGQSMAEIREDALAEIGLAYPLLRQMLRELGKRFVEAGIIMQADDIFWLEKDEVETNVINMERRMSLSSLAERVMQRKAFNKKMEQITPPPMIPFKKRILGIKTDSFIAHSENEQTENILKGIATSPGKVTAPACVLRGSEDFPRMRPGDVLVAGTTTPAWTPLFAMAAAVVTDIGGPLSHGSIVAREYGIPAVMGTGVATQRIKNGQMITVDGNAGTVTIVKNEA